jgi:cytochrome c-type biogenesis protein CcmH
MVLFWLLIASMVVIAMAFVITPLFYALKGNERKQNQCQVTLYREQIEKLKRQLQRGELSQAEYQQQSDALDQALLDAIPASAHKLHKKTNYLIALGLLILLPVVALALYWKIGSSQQLAQWLQSKQQAAVVQAEITQFGSTENIIVALREKLRQNPNSARGWYLLGKLYLSQQQFSPAAAAFTKANQLHPNDPETMQSYAESLFFANQQKLTPQSRALLDQVIALQPQNVDALNLVAMGAYRQGDYQTAINYWEKLLPFFPPQSEDGKALLDVIAKAQQKLHPK